MKGLNKFNQSFNLLKLHIEAGFHTHLPRKATQYMLSGGSCMSNKYSQYVRRLIHCPLPSLYPSLQITYVIPDNIFH